MAQYRQRLADTEARATAARRDLDQVRITERSGDGSVQVTVNSAGNLVDLVLPMRSGNAAIPAALPRGSCGACRPPSSRSPPRWSR